MGTEERHQHALQELKEKINLRERQMALAAKYITKYMMLHYQRKNAVPSVPSITQLERDMDFALEMVFAIGADLTNILEEASHG